MKTKSTYNKTFNALRIVFLAVAALMFGASVYSAIDGVKTGNMEQVIGATAVGAVSLAAPAVADPNVKRQLMKAGFMGGGLSRDEQTLIAFLETSSYVDANTLAAYKNQKVRFVDANYFFRVDITGKKKGQFDLVNETLAKANGITNVHAGRLNKGENAVISQILIGYATDAAIVDSANLVYDSVVTSWPTGLANGTLHIKQDGAYLIDPLPIALCGTQADSTASRGTIDSKQLRTPFVLEEEKQITIAVEAAQDMPANKHHIEVWLLGSKTRVRNGK
jgi:hypothetical protein